MPLVPELVYLLAPGGWMTGLLPGCRRDLGLAPAWALTGRFSCAPHRVAAIMFVVSDHCSFVRMYSGRYVSFSAPELPKGSVRQENS